MRLKNCIPLFLIICFTAPLIARGESDSGENTLTLIPLSHEIKDDFDSDKRYFIDISHIQTGDMVCSISFLDNEDYLMIDFLEPGDYFISGISERTEKTVHTIESFNRDISPFRVEEGKICITPLGFGWSKSIDDNGRMNVECYSFTSPDGSTHDWTLHRFLSDYPGYQKRWGIPEITKNFISKQIETVLKDNRITIYLEFTDLLSGDPITLEDLQGKVIVIDFWATWCSPCREEIPHLIDLYDQYKSQGVEFIGISLDKSDSAVIDFCKDKGITWLQHREETNTGIHKEWNITGIPQVFILDKDGVVISTQARGKLDSYIPQLLGRN
ncbi:TlpA family protein disulfide reductase [Spirochaeta isovalerica]|uniref:Thiol-disulfide isomerase/thioredoxin n=1 Tax=Spirochaeta isovalerica TaxID=150 RepID=A0A841RHQ6_9SPIO|nr:TlpA disulfide reductase family protein [Spirochaeta isovalerica]MBB6482068.1 thiol-disulfide isomerase/thioredoxin [Spirochaeta isovalerica]